MPDTVDVSLGVLMSLLSNEMHCGTLTLNHEEDRPCTDSVQAYLFAPPPVHRASTDDEPCLLKHGSVQEPFGHAIEQGSVRFESEVFVVCGEAPMHELEHVFSRDLLE